MADAIRAVLDGTDPDTVLVRVRTAEGVSLATRKDYGRPIDYLRHRSKNPISDIAFMAAELYSARYHEISAVGSNTQATINQLMKSVPITAEDRAMKDAPGGIMVSKGEVHVAADPSMRMLTAAIALKRIDEKLDKVVQEILRDLVIRERGVGLIAQRWQWQPEGAGVMVRYALERLVDVLEELDEDFAAFVRQERYAANEAKDTK